MSAARTPAPPQREWPVEYRRFLVCRQRRTSMTSALRLVALRFVVLPFPLWGSRLRQQQHQPLRQQLPPTATTNVSMNRQCGSNHPNHRQRNVISLLVILSVSLSVSACVSSSRVIAVHRATVLCACVCVRLVHCFFVRNSDGNQEFFADFWDLVLWGIDCLVQALEESSDTEARPQEAQGADDVDAAAVAVQKRTVMVSTEFQAAINGLVFHAKHIPTILPTHMRTAYAGIVADFLTTTVVPRVSTRWTTWSLVVVAVVVVVVVVPSLLRP